MQQTSKSALFALGQVVATPGALAALEKSGQGPQDFLSRHVHGDWGDLCDEDRNENQLSLEQGFRLLSSYRTLADVTLYVITEADRAITTILLPEEY
jgi:invasion protein IalB